MVGQHELKKVRYYMLGKLWSHVKMRTTPHWLSMNMHVHP
jgi:hypothetical protein